MSGRTFALTVLAAGYLLLSAYCAILVSHLASSHAAMPFDDLDGLIRSDYTLITLGATRAMMEQSRSESRSRS